MQCTSILGSSAISRKEIYLKSFAMSTVSGGTLLMGLLFHLNDYKWPTSKQFLEQVRPNLIDLLADKDLQLRALARLLLPWNWRYLPFRANVLATTIAKTWGVAASISRLPDSPVWAINATTIETGHRWRFRAEQEVAFGATGWVTGKSAIPTIRNFRSVPRWQRRRLSRRH